MSVPVPPAAPVRVGLAITTIGRPELSDLLASVAASTRPPVAVAVADQSPHGLALDRQDYPFPVILVRSGGGISRGRNHAVAALPVDCDVVGFPNDDSTYPPDLLAGIAAAFEPPGPAAVACRLQEPGGARFALPASGTPLTRRTVWLAIEPALFVSRDALRTAGGFRPDLGAGAGTAWGSGEGTDLLLRVLAGDGTVIARPDLAVHGRGERRSLDDDALVAKHRSYARGTGRVYRLHGYPLRDRLRTLAGPVVQATRHAPEPGLSLRLAVARTAGRLEGLTGRSVAVGPGWLRRLEAPEGAPTGVRPGQVP